MSEPTLCDANFERGVSPFDRILYLGYYDGPTSGLAKCADAAKAYRFALVAWNSTYENRVYALAETDVKVFDSVVQMLTDIEKPRWPFWTPRWQFGSSLEESRMSSRIDEALAKIPAASLLIATDHLDESILACRALESAVRDRIPKEGTLPDPKDWEFWQEYLGLIEN